MTLDLLYLTHNRRDGTGPRFLTLWEQSALLEIAKAARRRKAFGHDKHCAWVTGGPNPPSCDCGHVELCDALARLDSGASEEDA